MGDYNNLNLDINEITKLANSLKVNDIAKPSNQLSEMDLLLNDQQLRIMKTVLPYMTLTNKRQFAVLIKMIELKKTIDIFNTSEVESADLFPQKEFDQLTLLNDLKSSSDESTQKILNKVIMLMNIKKYFNGGFHTHNSNPYTEDHTIKNNIIINEQDQAEIVKATDTSSSYNDFLSSLNKIIKEKDGSNNGQ